MFKFKKMIRIFKDDQMQKDFEKNGFIIVDFYSPKQVEEVKNLFFSLHTNDEKGFFSSVLSQDEQYRKTVDTELKRIGHHCFEEILTNYKIVNGAFFVKYPGVESYLHAHQDMTLVDESKFNAISIWATTIDLTDENGVMYLLPGSHRFFPTYRAPTIPMFYDQIKEEIKDYMIPYYLKAGQAIIFDHSILHYSTTNMSDEARIISNFYFTQKDAKFVICYHNKNDEHYKGKVELFEQNDSFMTSYKQFGAIYDRPKMGRSLGLVDYNFPQLTLEQLENQFGKRKLREQAPAKKHTETPKTASVSASKEKLSFLKKIIPAHIFKK